MSHLTEGRKSNELLYGGGPMDDLSSKPFREIAQRRFEARDFR